MRGICLEGAVSTTSSVFTRAKSLSDFLAFHVRLLFCATLGSVAASIPVSNMLSAWDAGREYSAWDHAFELSVMLLFLGYAIAMYVYILRVGFIFISNKISPSEASVFSRIVSLLLKTGFVVVESAAIVAVLMFAVLQILRIFEIDFSQAECVVQDFLSDTNYPFTPDKPAHCP